MTICFFMGPYPTEEHPINAFTDMLITEMTNQGVECIAIAPQSRTEHLFRKLPLATLKRIKELKKGGKITIYSPLYNSYSAKNVFGYNTAKLSQRSYEKVAIGEYIKRGIKADALYGQFFSLGGLTAAKLGYKINIPSFVDNGESTLKSLDILNRKMCKSAISKLTGIISVSTANKTELLESGYVDKSFENKIKVVVNAIDNTRFYITDKNKMRDELKFPRDVFITSFTGHYIERKGTRVLSDVLDGFDDVYSIFIGKGPLEPTCKNILHKGTVPHENVYKYLNATDVFVLPTLAEGCCNAILEAMACGLPIISSDLSFNDDILDSTCSIRVNPKDETAIKKAIQCVRNDNDLREKLSKGAAAKAKEFDIYNRARIILEFIKENM